LIAGLRKSHEADKFMKAILPPREDAERQIDLGRSGCVQIGHEQSLSMAAVQRPRNGRFPSLRLP
jgi:hypothetical protein